MIVLAINSATTVTEIALIKNRKVLAEKSWISNKNEAEKIPPAIRGILKKNGLNYKDIGMLFVVSGPGSFTGLRVGVTIGNTLGFGLKIPMKSCTTFELMHAKISSSAKNKTVTVISAGGGQVAVMKKGLKEPKIASREELGLWLNHEKGLQYALLDFKKEQQAEIQKILKSAKLKLLPGNAEKSFGKAVIGLFAKSPKHKIVKPNYLQKPTITASKKPVFT